MDNDEWKCPYCNAEFGGPMAKWEHVYDVHQEEFEKMIQESREQSRNLREPQLENEESIVQPSRGTHIPSSL